MAARCRQGPLPYPGSQMLRAFALLLLPPTLHCSIAVTVRPTGSMLVSSLNRGSFVAVRYACSQPTVCMMTSLSTGALAAVY